MKNTLPIDDTWKIQGVLQAKKFLWNSITYYLYRDAVSKNIEVSMAGKEKYTEEYENFLLYWESAMNEVYSGTHIMDRTHLSEISKRAMDFIAKSPLFGDRELAQLQKCRGDIAFQMALYYFFKKKVGWVQKMDSIQVTAKDQSHRIMNHVGSDRRHEGESVQYRVH